MRTLPEILSEHERALAQLNDPSNQSSTTPEVRAIMIAKCKNAIEQLKRDIEEEVYD